MVGALQGLKNRIEERLMGVESRLAGLDEKVETQESSLAILQGLLLRIDDKLRVLVENVNGEPVARMGKLTTDDANYKIIFIYNVPKGRHFYLQSLAFNEGSTPAQFEKLQWRLTLMDRQQFTDKSSNTNFSLSFDAKMPSGSTVLVEARSTDGTSITPEVAMTGSLV